MNSYRGTIFDLPQSSADLPSLNQGLANLQYDQVQIQRSYTGTSAFGNGDVNLKWSTSGSKWWIPARSYMRLRVEFEDSAGNPLDMVDDLAPAMNWPANLFTGAELRLNGKTLSRISENFPQVDTLCQRIYKSKSQLDSSQSASQWMQPTFEERQALVCSDGNFSDKGGYYSSVSFAVPSTTLGLNVADTMAVATTGVATLALGAGVASDFFRVGDIITSPTAVTGTYTANETYQITEITTNLLLKVVRTDGTAIAARGAAAIFTGAGSAVDRIEYGYRVDDGNSRSSLEGIWQPLALPIWRNDKALPCGKWELILNTQDSSNWQEYIVESGYVDKTVTTDFQINVVDMFLYIATCDGPNMNDPMNREIDYLIDMDEIQCQVQDVDTGTSNQYKRFNVRPSAQSLAVAFQDRSVGADSTLRPVSNFHIQSNATFSNGEEGLSEFYILYNGEQKPSPQADPSFTSPNDYLRQRYMETVLYSGNYFNPGGVENYSDWLKRGLYMYFAWPKDGNSRSDQVSVNYKFSVSNGTNANVLLFDWAKKLGYVSIRNGEVSSVRVEEY
ncbi:MAG: hypothetical protein ACFFD1_06190 [Candidatus Thorarchaeota archaeon]